MSKGCPSWKKLATPIREWEKTYAIQAGREIRIMVLPDGISDEESSLMARDIAKRIEKEVTYPGEIKITVVREKRFTEFAR